MSGCSQATLKTPKSLPSIIRDYKNMPLSSNIARMQDTGVYLNEGDLYSILATGRVDLWPSNPSSEINDVRPEHGWPFMMRIGKQTYFTPFFENNASTRNAQNSGHLYLGIRNGDVDQYGEPLDFSKYSDNNGLFNVDIIVWEKEDWVQIADFFHKMKQKDPTNKAIIDAFDQASKQKETHVASKKASKEMEGTEKKIKKLKEKPDQENQENNLVVDVSYVKAKKPTSSVSKIAPTIKHIEIEVEPNYEKLAKSQETGILPEIGKYYAVVIGIGKYQDERIPKLKYTTVDADSIYDILTDPQL